MANRKRHLLARWIPNSSDVRATVVQGLALGLLAGGAACSGEEPAPAAQEVSAGLDNGLAVRALVSADSTLGDASTTSSFADIEPAADGGLVPPPPGPWEPPSSADGGLAPPPPGPWEPPSSADGGLVPPPPVPSDAGPPGISPGWEEDSKRGNYDCTGIPLPESPSAIRLPAAERYTGSVKVGHNELAMSPDDPRANSSILLFGFARNFSSSMSLASTAIPSDGVRVRTWSGRDDYNGLQFVETLVCTDVGNVNGTPGWFPVFLELNGTNPRGVKVLARETRVPRGLTALSYEGTAYADVLEEVPVEGGERRKSQTSYVESGVYSRDGIVTFDSDSFLNFAEAKFSLLNPIVATVRQGFSYFLRKNTIESPEKNYVEIMKYLARAATHEAVFGIGSTKNPNRPMFAWAEYNELQACKERLSGEKFALIPGGDPTDDVVGVIFERGADRSCETSGTGWRISGKMHRFAPGWKQVDKVRATYALQSGVLSSPPGNPNKLELSEESDDGWAWVDVSTEAGRAQASDRVTRIRQAEESVLELAPAAFLEVMLPRAKALPGPDNFLHYDVSRFVR